MNPNQTRRDARDRLLGARIGSLAEGSSVEYLLELERGVCEWLRQITDETRAAILRRERDRWTKEE